MSRAARIGAVVIGVVLVGFALLVALYAHEPFNIATLFGLAGAAMIVRVWRAGTAER